MCEPDCTCCYCTQQNQKIVELTSAPIKPKFKVDQMVYWPSGGLHINFGHIQNVYVSDRRVTYKVKFNYDRYYTIEETEIYGIEKQKYSINDTVKLLINDYKWTVLSAKECTFSIVYRSKLEETNPDLKPYYQTFKYKLRSIDDPSVTIYKYQFEIKKCKTNISITNKPYWFKQIFG